MELGLRVEGWEFGKFNISVQVSPTFPFAPLLLVPFLLDITIDTFVSLLVNGHNDHYDITIKYEYKFVTGIV